MTLKIVRCRAVSAESGPAGLLLLRRDSLRDPALAVLLTISVVTAGWLCFLIYADGGATQWGGRFFHLLVPLLAPVVAVAGVRSLGGVRPSHRRLALIAIGVVALAIGAMGIRTAILYREIHRDTRLAAERRLPRRPSGISDRSLLVVAPPKADGFSRMFWRDEPNFTTISSSIPSVFHQIRQLRADGLREAYVLTTGDVRLMEFGGRYDLEALGWKRLSAYQVPGTSIHILHYGPATS